MMMTSISTMMYLLLFSNAILLGAAAIALLGFQRRIRKLESFWHSPVGAAVIDVDSDINRDVDNDAESVQQRIAALQDIVDTIVTNSEQTKPPEPPANVSVLPIANAVRMARQGASIDELTRNCGLSIGEARLMQKLHGQRSA